MKTPRSLQFSCRGLVAAAAAFLLCSQQAKAISDPEFPPDSTNDITCPSDMNIPLIQYNRAGPDDTIPSAGNEDSACDCPPGSSGGPDIHIGPRTGGGGCSSCGGSAQEAGMPRWSVSEPYINLWIKDVPLGYRPAKGPDVAFRLAYKLRENASGFSTSEFSVGKRWNCAWLSYVRTGADGLEVHPAGGGVLKFGWSGGYNFYSNTKLETVSGGYRIVNRDGSTNYFGMSAYINGDHRYYLTAITDRAGQSLQFNYENEGSSPGVVRLLHVIDTDGRTNTVNYAASGYSTNLITSVIDGFGRTNFMAYDSQGRLTNIVDVAGLSSSFAYDSNDWMTNLTTPYGVTTFAATVDDDNYLQALKVTDAGGGRHLWLYRWDLAGVLPYIGSRPDPSPYGNDLWSRDTDIANSFYWGPKQVPLLTHTNDLPNLTAGEYLLARRKHWLGINDNTVLSMVQEFSPDGLTAGQQTWYQYAVGQVQPLQVLRLLPDYQTSFVYTERNSWGAITSEVSTWTRPDTTLGLRTNSFAYSSDGLNLLAAFGPDGEREAAYGYQAHLVTSMTNALNEVTRFTYNTAGQQTSVTYPSGLVRSNIYFSPGAYAGWLQDAVDYAGAVPQRTNSYTYTNGLVYTHTDERGLTVTNSWDALGRLTCARYPDGTSVSNIYSNLDRVKTTDRMGFSTSHVFDSMRRLVYQTNALGGVTRYSYCDCGSLDSVTDPLSQTTYYFYDLAGRRTITAHSDGYCVTNTYDALGRVVNTTDTAGASTSFAYNNQGLRYTSWNDQGTLSTVQFDIHHRVISQTDANSVTVTNAYDLAGRVTVRGYPDGGLETFGYSANVAAMTSYTNQIGKISRYGYDAFGRKIAETNANLEVVSFQYSTAGDLLVLTDGKSQNTTWKYDLYGRVTNKLDNLSQEMFRYAYDANGRLTNRWTPAKGTTGYSYDSAGNLTAIHYPQSAVNLYYDPLSRVTNMVDAVGTTAYGYTSAGLLLSEDGPWANDTVSYAYNNRLRNSLSVQAPNASAWTQSYGWDSMKRLSSITSPAGTFGYQYINIYQNTGPGSLVGTLSLPGGAFIYGTYDSAARQLSTTLYNSGWAALNSHSYTYNLAGQRTQQTFAAGNYVDYTYDESGQLKTASGKEYGGSPDRRHEQLGYAYDAAGNLSTRTNNALIQSFTVNSLNELSGANRSGTFTVAGAATPAATAVTVNGSSANLYQDFTFAKDAFTLADGSNTFTAVATDSYGRWDTNTITAYLPASVSFGYDQNGSLTNDGVRNFEYDTENQLTNVYVAGQWRSQFVYDGKMRRRIRREYTWQSGVWNLQSEIHYVYDGNLVIQERDGNNQPQVSYTRGRDLSGTLEGAGGIGGMLARTDCTLFALCSSLLASTALYHADGNGNITAMLSTNQQIAARYLYDPYGNLLGKSGPLADANLYRFSSKEFHPASGLVYYLHRYYEPSLQRWMNGDPLLDAATLAPKPSRVTTLAGVYVIPNAFEPLRNAPPNTIDSFGQIAIPIPWPFVFEWPIGTIITVGSAVVAGLIAGYAICHDHSEPKETCPYTTEMIQEEMGNPYDFDGVFFPRMKICVYTCPTKGVVREYLPENAKCGSSVQR